MQSDGSTSYRIHDNVIVDANPVGIRDNGVVPVVNTEETIRKVGGNRNARYVRASDDVWP